MWILHLIFVLANIVAAPGYLSVVRLETDRNIVILSTISSLFPALILIPYPDQIINVILFQIIYMCIGIYLTMNK
jgi:hypothetical protein